MCAKRCSRLAVAALILALGAAPAPTFADDPGTISGDKGTDMLVDLLVMRPLGIVATAVGAVAFVVALPFTIPSDSVDASARELVGKPAQYTFSRPLGEFYLCGADARPCEDY